MWKEARQTLSASAGTGQIHPQIIIKFNVQEGAWCLQRKNTRMSFPVLGSLAEENKPCRSYSPKYLQTPFATDAVPYMHREAQAVQAAGLLWGRRRAAAGLCQGTCTWQGIKAHPTATCLHACRESQEKSPETPQDLQIQDEVWLQTQKKGNDYRQICFLTDFFLDYEAGIIRKCHWKDFLKNMVFKKLKP